MKKIKNIIFLLGIFVIALLCIFFVFNNSMINISLKNKTKIMVKYVSTLESDNYYYKNGVLYDSNSNIISTDYYINGEGNIIKDKYNNIVLEIKTKNRCISKTAFGKVNITSSCDDNNIVVQINKNNSQITFNFNRKIIEYLVSKNDDCTGKWIKLNKNKLVVNMFESGNYYIWFKDENGYLSETINFDVNCLLGNNSQFSKDNLYCIGSTIIIDDEKWIVIEDYNKEITLMKINPINKKLSHSNQISEYKWSDSLINTYLNSEYIYSLNNDIQSSLVEVEICNNSSGTLGCDSNDGCGGYKKSTIEKYKWSCDSYTKSKVRIISYDEYSYLYDSIKNKEILYGNYWTINSYKENNSGISIISNGEVFLGEPVNNLLDIRPVITIKR